MCSAFRPGKDGPLAIMLSVDWVPVKKLALEAPGA